MIIGIVTLFGFFFIVNIFGITYWRDYNIIPISSLVFVCVGTIIEYHLSLLERKRPHNN